MQLSWYDIAMKLFDKAINAYRAASGKSEQGIEFPPEESGRKVEEKLEAAIKPPEIESGIDKAAKFILLMDKESASRILSHFNDKEVELISRRIAHIKKVDRKEARKILEDFGVLKSGGVPSKGGPEAARRILTDAFGDQKGLSIFKKVLPLGTENPFDFLDDLEVQQLYMLLKKEPAWVVSVILPQIDAGKASQLLESFNPELQKDIVKRIAKMKKVSPEALIKVAEALREKIRRQGRIITEEIDGKAALAGMLRYMSLDKEDEILDMLEEYNPEVSKEIRESLITIDVLFLINDLDLQDVFRDFSEGELAVILKGKSDEIREKVFSNISERRRMMVKEEMDHLGPMKRSEVDKATREFLQYIREMEEDRKIVIHRDDQYV